MPSSCQIQDLLGIGSWADEILPSGVPCPLKVAVGPVPTDLPARRARGDQELVAGRDHGRASRSRVEDNKASWAATKPASPQPQPKRPQQRVLPRVDGQLSKNKATASDRSAAHIEISEGRRFRSWASISGLVTISREQDLQKRYDLDAWSRGGRQCPPSATSCALY